MEKQELNTMKKKMSVVVVCLLMAAVMLTACGTKETVDTDVDNKTVNEVVVNTPTTVPEASTPTSVPAPAVTDKIDIVIGKDIPCYDDDMPISSFPELHIYVTGDFVRQADNGPFKYAIPNNNIVLDVSSSVWLEQCAETYVIPHYETTEYGRYLVDVDYSEDISRTSTYITVYDTQINAGIRVVIGLGNENNVPTDEQLLYIKQYGLAEVEYIKNQVSNWPQDFAGSESAAAPVETPAEADVKVYSLNAYADITVTLTYSDDGTVELLCQSPSDATVQQKLVATADGKLQALREGGEMFMEITVGDGKMFLDTPFMEFANYFGDYTLTE